MAALAALLHVLTAAAAEAAVPDVRAFVRCQRALHGVGTTVLAGRTEQLGACVDAWARCGAPAARDSRCADRARTRCERSVAAIGRGEDGAVAVVTRRCTAVDPADLFAPGGLASVRTALACDAAGIPVGDVRGAAHCAAWRYGCHAEALVGEVPSELDDLLAVDAACGMVQAAPSAAETDAADTFTGPAPWQCERGARRARARYARVVLPALGRCVERLLACEVGGGAACEAAAGGCFREHAGVVRAARRLEAAVVRACGAPVSAAAVAAACVVGRALRDGSPRSEELLGRTTLALDGNGCAPLAPAPSTPPTSAPAPTADPRATRTPPATTTPLVPPIVGRTGTPARTRTPAPTRTATPIPTRTATPTPTAVVRALAIDPARPAILYAGVDGGGVFQSIDGAANWTALVAGLGDRAVRALVVDPQRPATLYAGTASGVFRSDDGAGSWTLLSAGLTTRDVQTLAIDPARPRTLYAGTNGGGVFRSDDGAGSWTPLSAGLTTRDVRAFAIDSTRPATLYVGTKGGGVFRSDDGAGSWTPLSAGLTNRDVRVLAVDPSRPATLYAGTNGGGVFKSGDRSASWTPTSLAASFVTGRAVRALAVDPARPATVYAGTDGGGVFKSGDGGATWTITALGGSFAGAALVHALALDPSNPAIIYAGTATGAVFKSTNGGGVWTFASAGLPAPR